MVAILGEEEGNFRELVKLPTPPFDPCSHTEIRDRRSDSQEF